MPRTPAKQPQTTRSYVEIRVSPAQAWAIQRVMDSVLDEPERTAELFNHHKTLTSAHRGRDAVTDAVRQWEDKFVGGKSK